MAAPLSEMRAQMDAVMDDWGMNCAVSRFTPGATDAAGHLTAGTYTSIATNEPIWIQTVGGTSRIRDYGLNAETTHLGFQKFSGLALQAKDRVLPSGSVVAYDVVRADVMESHRMAELKLVLKA